MTNVPLAVSLGPAAAASIAPIAEFKAIGRAVQQHLAEMLALLKAVGANLDLAMRRTIAPCLGPDAQYAAGAYTALQLALQDLF